MSLQDLIVSLRTGIQGDVTTRLLFAGAIVVVLLAIAGGIVIVLRQLSPRGRLEALLDSQVARRKGPAWAVRIVTVLLVLVAVLGTRVYLGNSTTCAQCHVNSAESQTLGQSAHKGIACGACHPGRGLLNGASLAVDYARWTWSWAQLGTIPKELATQVDSRACSACHADIGPTRVVNGIRIRHSDFLEAGVACDYCHSGVAHPGVNARDTSPAMRECLPCHDGTHAPTTCATCHPTGITQPAPSGKPIAQLTITDRPDSCYTCHDPKPCTTCHGEKMPHPAGWSPKSGAPLGGTHVREAFVHLDRCWRCHFDGTTPGTPSQKACSCHQLIAKGGMHGGPAWIAEHGLEATGRKAGVLADCFTCHREGFCTDCHPASFNSMYNPKLGPDNYPRNSPIPPGYVDRASP